VVQQKSVTLVDDLDGSKAAETVVFSLDGASYEIDLNKRNAATLRKALTEFVENGRRVKQGSSLDKRVQQRARRSGVNSAAIREWAAAQGIAVSERGRISADVVSQYEAAQQG
jgi:Lsr2